jgi:hypothetical protein
MARRFNYRRVKIHHSYTISELSALIGAHKHTIGRWIAAGLKTTDARRPLDDSSSALLNVDFKQVQET